MLALVCPLPNEFPQPPMSILTASKCQTQRWEAAIRRNPGQLSHNPASAGISSPKSSSAAQDLPCQSRQLLRQKAIWYLCHFCITPLAYEMRHRSHCLSFVLIQHNECIIPLACSLGLASLIVHLGLIVFTQAFTGSVCVCVCGVCDRQQKPA